jgi:hypothetical protein
MSKHIDFDVPCPETLAGIYLCVEADEDVTVRPRRIEPIEIGPVEDVPNSAPNCESAPEAS